MRNSSVIKDTCAQRVSVQIKAKPCMFGEPMEGVKVRRDHDREAGSQEGTNLLTS